MAEDLSLLVSESGLPVEDFGAVVTVLEELRSAPLSAAPPSGELAALLAGSAAPASPHGRGPVAPVGRRRTRPALVAALVLGLSGGAAAAAAANVLPDPLQSAVSDFSERFLPFQFPAPDADERPAPAEQGPGAGLPDGQPTFFPRDGAGSGPPPPDGAPVGTTATSPQEADASTAPELPADAPAPDQAGVPDGASDPAPAGPTDSPPREAPTDAPRQQAPAPEPDRLVTEEPAGAPTPDSRTTGATAAPVG